MRIQVPFRAPDNEEIVWLLAINKDGEPDYLAVIDRENLAAAIEPLRQSVKHEEEHGGPSMDAFIARRDFLQTLEMLQQEDRLPAFTTSPASPATSG